MTGSRRRRKRLAEGIFEDQYGLAAVVKVGRRQREQRFPNGTDLERMKSWRIQTRADLDFDRDEAHAQVAGTLRHDGTAWIDRKKGLAIYKADRSHLRAWFATLGDVQRSRITAELVAAQMAAWQAAGVAARTVRHRARVLRELYKGLDGPRAKSPLDHLTLPAPPAAAPVAVPLATIRKVAVSLKAAGLAKDYARFVVRATTGQRPAQIMRAVPDDVDLRRRIWFVRPAKGGRQVPMPLNAEMIAAWKAFAKADAWGAFDTGRAAETLRAHGWPKDVRPYDLRHTFAIDHLLAGTDLGDVQGFLGHRHIETTRTFYAPILVARLRKATGRRVVGFK